VGTPDSGGVQAVAGAGWSRWAPRGPSGLERVGAVCGLGQARLRPVRCKSGWAKEMRGHGRTSAGGFGPNEKKGFIILFAEFNFQCENISRKS
jgi:hypothetical protein